MIGSNNQQAPDDVVKSLRRAKRISNELVHRSVARRICAHEYGRKPARQIGARAREARLGKIIRTRIGSLNERKQCHRLFKYRQLSQAALEFGIGRRSCGQLLAEDHRRIRFPQ